MIQTLNIIEMIDNSVERISSFSISEENRDSQVSLAESKFTFLISERESDLTEEVKDSYLERGFYQRGNFKLLLSWSEKTYI